MKHLQKSILSIVMVLALLASLLVLPASADTTLVNLFDLNQLTIGWVTDTSSSPDGAFRTSHYIPVETGDVITFGAAVSNQGWHLVVYDEAKEAIASGTIHNGISSVATLDSATSIMSYTIPAAGAYVRMVVDARYMNQYLVTKNQPFTVDQFNAFWNPTVEETTLTNLANKSTMTVGWTDGTGATSPDDGFRTTAAIPVSEGDVITFGAADSAQGWHIVTLDSAQSVTGAVTLSSGITKVENVSDTTSIMSYTVPANVGYLRFVIAVALVDQYLITKNQPFTAAQYNEYWNPTSDDTDGELVNLYDETGAFQGYIDGAGNQVSGNGHITLTAIPVAQGDVITFGAAVSTQGFHLITLDANGNVTSQASINDALTIQHALDASTSIMSYTAPAGVAAIRMVVDVNYKSKYLYTKNQPFGVAEYNAYFGIGSEGDKEDDPVDETNPLYGKTALFVGDSICFGQWDNEPRQGWAGRIAEAYGMTATNAGIGGTTISNIRSGRVVNQLHSNKSNNYDYVILQGGTNDGWGDMASTGTTPAPVGTITTSFDVADFDITTFAGGLEELFYYAFQYFPNAKIGFMTTFATPLGATQNLGATGDMSAYYNLAVEICEKWGVQCLDLYNDRYVSNDLMQVNTYNCLRDPLHPNAKGYDNLAPYIGDWMERMVDNETYKAKPFTNKRAIFVGDSISYGHNDTPQGYSWAGRLADSMGIISDNQSCSGWSLSTIRASQIVQMLQKNKDNQYDYVIMQGGINDSWDNAPIGVMTDSYDPADFNLATFAGALEHLFYSAYQYYPNARLGYIINFKLPAAASDMGVYHDIALQICEKWKVSCYDMYADDEVTASLDAGTLKNMADAGHPNKAGYDILTPYIEKWFKTIPYADISSFESKMPDIDQMVAKMPYEQNGILYINECETLYGWTGAFSTELTLDKEDKQQGSAALVLKGGNTKLSDSHYVGAMAFLTFPKTANLSGYDTISFDFYLGADMTGKQGQLQLNFATTGEDGYNTLVTINDATTGWHTATFSTDTAAFKVVDFDWSQINKLRFTWWNLNNSAQPMTVKIDNIRMYNQATLDEKPEKVQAVIDAIDAIGEVTADNYTEKLTPIENAENMLESLIGTYGESVSSEVTNLTKLVRAREDYNAFASQTPPTPPTPTTPDYGDVNGDGAVDAKDALMILQAAVDKITLNEEQTVEADVNGDDAIDAKDALLVLQKAVEKIDKFPVEA